MGYHAERIVAVATGHGKDFSILPGLAGHGHHLQIEGHVAVREDYAERFFLLAYQTVGRVCPLRPYSRKTEIVHILLIEEGSVINYMKFTAWLGVENHCGGGSVQHLPGIEHNTAQKRQCGQYRLSHNLYQISFKYSQNLENYNYIWEQDLKTI